MSALLIGDSHFGRLRGPRLRALELRAGRPVASTAVGGSRVDDLADQLRPGHAVVAVSVGTNDAAPWKQVPLDAFERELRLTLAGRPESLVLMTPPGVDEARLRRTADRSNAVLGQYAAAAARVAGDLGAGVLDARSVLLPLGSAAWSEDGVHLSDEGYELLFPRLARALARATDRTQPT